MKKTFFTLIIALCCGQLALANLSNKSGAEKTINHLLDSAEIMAKSDKDIAIDLVGQASDYARKIDFEYGIARGKFVLGYISKNEGKSDKSIVYYLEASQLLNELDDRQSVLLNVVANENIALSFHRHFQYDQAIKHFDRSVELAKNVDWKYGVTRGLYLKARSLKGSGDYVSAISELFKSSEIALGDNNSTYLVKINNLLGLVFKEIGEYSKAREHYLEVLLYRDKIKKFPWHAGRALHNIANTYIGEGDSVKAIEFYNKAIVQKLATGNAKNAFISYMDLGEVLMAQGKLEESKLNYEAALATKTNVEGNPDKFKIYKQLAELSALQGNTNEFVAFNKKYTSYLENDLLKNKNILETDQKYNIQLVTQTYYNLIEKKRLEEMYQHYAIMASIFLLLSIMVYFTYVKVKSFRLRRILEKELREAMIDIKLDD